MNASYKHSVTVEAVLVNSTTAAAMLDISPRTLWDLREQKKIPHVRYGRRVQYRVADIKAYAAALPDASTPAIAPVLTVH